VPSDERVVIAEETPEINIPHSHQLRLVANREMSVSLKDLVYDSLRMRPDRMIVGEVRCKDEAEALLDVLLAGQARGSYATFHAQSAGEALARMRSFGIDEMDLKSLDCIIVQRRMLLYDPKKRKSREVRRVVEIAEFDGELKPLYRNGKLSKESALIERAAEGFGLSMKEMEKELQRRKRLISKAEPGYQEFYETIQQQLFGGC
jgi:Flp pilus assembly CpaF family ATPase